MSRLLDRVLSRLLDVPIKALDCALTLVDRYNAKQRRKRAHD